MVIVVGAESFIGTYLVDRLIREGVDVIATGRHIESNEYFNSTHGVTCVNLDISDPISFQSLALGFEKVDALVHLAGLMPANVSALDYSTYEYVKVNVLGTVNILEYCRQVGISKYIYTSSESDVSSLYGGLESIDEDTPRSISFNNDHTVYSVTKVASMDLIEHYSQAYGMTGVYFRLPNIFGYGQLLEHYKDGVRTLNGFGTFLLNAINGQNIELWGDPEKGRDIVYVKDLVSMIVGAINSSAARGLYCVGTGRKVTLREQVEGIVDVFCLGEKSRIVYRPDMPSVRSYIYSINKANRDLGYYPVYGYHDMLLDWKYEFDLDRFPHLRNRVNCLSVL